MKKHFNLDSVPIESPTTLGGTTIDLMFAINIDSGLLPLVSYFSYHRLID